MPRAVIYARFSSDLQRDRSIDDQIALCRDYAQRNGYQIVATFEDRAVTGASIHLRPGIQQLLAAAKVGGFEFVIAESLSRIARNEEEGPAIRRRLEFAGVQIVTPSDGVVSPLMHGLRTIIDSQFLVDLKGMIRRGMKGVVRDGRHAGGRPYGYQAVPGKPGELVVDEAHAAIVRRIFDSFVGGDMPRAIADALNREHIAPPRGAIWRASTINGDAKRRFGILRNQLYTGVNVWNRGRYVRDPDNGARVRRVNPSADWLISEMPHLRIVADDVFEKAQRILAQRAREASPHNQHRPRRLLSGLLRCGACGAGMSIKDYDHGRPRLICTQRREAGSSACSNGRTYYADEVETLVVDGLRRDLGSAEAVEIFIRAYNEEKRKLASGGEAARAGLLSRLATVERSIERAVAAVIDERITHDEAERHLPALRAEREELRAQVARLGLPPKVIVLRQPAVETYLRDLDRLAEVANGDLREGDAGAANALRSIIETVTIVPGPAGSIPTIRVDGHLAVFVDQDSNAPYSGGDGGAGCPAWSHPPTERIGFSLLLEPARAA